MITVDRIEAAEYIMDALELETLSKEELDEWIYLLAEGFIEQAVEYYADWLDDERGA